jgi:hypothetical protein
MDIVLHPRAAPSDRVRVWVGAFQTAHAPVLDWLLDGNPAAPDVLRPMTSARPDAMLPAGVLPGDVDRAFAGVYEFTGLQPDTVYWISLLADGHEMRLLEARTLPASVPSDLNQSFNVLLASCFHQAEDPGGLAGIIVSQLKAAAKPHLTILAGDQVYLDLPTLQNFPDDQAWLADKFENDYTLNWSSALGYREVLSAAASVSSPDDHEFWNNYPHPSPFIGNSLTDDGQRRWREAALAMYDAFQRAYPAQIGEGVEIDVNPLSFFIADTRTGKHVDRDFTMKDQARDKLDAWVTKVINNRGFGVFVSGQSVFAQAAGGFGGAVGDYELANYRDYEKIVNILKRLVDAGRPVLCLTGDVHWGRVATTTDIRTGRLGFAEVISSPVSLVSTIGADQKNLAVNAIAGLFGRGTPWPRHSDPAALPSFLAYDVLGPGFPCSRVHGQRGNHVVMLSFRQNGSGLELRVKYWPIHRDADIGRPIEVGPIDLTNA